MGDRAAARLRVLFGQPVKLGGASFGVIRIALGADMLMDAFCRGDPPLSEENVPAAGEGGGVARLLTQVIWTAQSISSEDRQTWHRFLLFSDKSCFGV